MIHIMLLWPLALLGALGRLVGGQRPGLHLRRRIGDAVRERASLYAIRGLFEAGLRWPGRTCWWLPRTVRDSVSALTATRGPQ